MTIRISPEHTACKVFDSSAVLDTLAKKQARYYLNLLLESWHEVAKRMMKWSVAAATARLAAIISNVLQGAHSGHVGNCNQLAVPLCFNDHAVKLICPCFDPLHTVPLELDVRTLKNRMQEGQGRCCYCSRGELTLACSMTPVVTDMPLSKMHHLQNAVPVTLGDINLSVIPLGHVSLGVMHMTSPVVQQMTYTACTMVVPCCTCLVW